MTPGSTAADLHHPGNPKLYWPWRLDREKQALILEPRLKGWDVVPFIATPAAFSVPVLPIVGLLLFGLIFGPPTSAENLGSGLVMLVLCFILLSVAWAASAVRLAEAREAAKDQARRTPVLLRRVGDEFEAPAAGATFSRSDAVTVTIREDRTLPGLRFYTPLVVVLEAGPPPGRAIVLGVFDGGKRHDAEDFAEAARELLGLAPGAAC